MFRHFNIWNTKKWRWEEIHYYRWLLLWRYQKTKQQICKKNIQSIYEVYKSKVSTIIINSFLNLDIRKLQNDILAQLYSFRKKCKLLKYKWKLKAEIIKMSYILVLETKWDIHNYKEYKGIRSVPIYFIRFYVNLNVSYDHLEKWFMIFLMI